MNSVLWQHKTRSNYSSLGEGLVQDGFVQWTKDKIIRVLTWVVNEMNCTRPACLRNSYVQQIFLSPANVFRGS